MNEVQPTPSVALSIRRMLDEIRQFAAREPVKAATAAFGVGLLVNLLPARAVIGAVTVVGATLMRPVLLSLGATKAMELCCQKTSNHFKS